MIELHLTNQKFPGNIIGEVKNGKIHVVCMAKNGLTHLNVYAELYYKLEKEIVNKSVDLVNNNMETGTLFPKANISILPIVNNIRVGNTNPDRMPFYDLRKCIEDVFKANEEFIKSEIIYFTLESSYIDKSVVLKIIQEIIENSSHKNLKVKTVWFEQ
jgi:ABC-type phosphate transport system ATPase subunit